MDNECKTQWPRLSALLLFKTLVPTQNLAIIASLPFPLSTCASLNYLNASQSS